MRGDRNKGPEGDGWRDENGEIGFIQFLMRYRMATG
jgi:hypothetical protein